MSDREALAFPDRVGVGVSNPTRLCVSSAIPESTFKVSFMNELPLEHA